MLMIHRASKLIFRDLQCLTPNINDDDNDTSAKLLRRHLNPCVILLQSWNPSGVRT